MFSAAVTFFILAIVSYLLGAYEVFGITMAIGKILIGVFLVTSLVSLLYGLYSRNTHKRLNL